MERKREKGKGRYVASYIGYTLHREDLSNQDGIEKGVRGQHSALGTGCPRL